MVHVQLPEETYKKLLSDHRKWQFIKIVKFNEMNKGKEYTEMLKAAIELVEKEIDKMGEGIKELRKKGIAE